LDTDSSSLLPSALVFVGFLFLFSYLSLAEHSGTNGNGHHNERSSPRAVVAFAPFKYACVIAVTLSGLALAISIQPLGWWPITILSLALLVFLTIIGRSISVIAHRSPSKARRWSRPLLGLLPSSADQRPASLGLGNGSSNHLNDDEPARDPIEEREGLVFTEDDLVSLDRRNREMVRSILRLDTTNVREIMVPRLDMVAVEVNSPLSDVVELMGQSGHSRLPVYEESIDHIVGIVHARDLLTLLARPRPDSSLRDVSRPAFFIPETKRLDDLLEELQQKSLQMAIVVDEYGGTEGLVSMEDLLEEIVGEIEDEFSQTEEPEIVHLPNGSALVDAGVTTEDFEKLFHARLDSPDIDTVGGYVYRALGRIPQAGDTVVTDHLRIEVVSILGRRLRKLRIDRITESVAARPSV
jgi:CBS domain containing-hemolysin-like protein